MWGVCCPVLVVGEWESININLFFLFLCFEVDKGLNEKSTMDEGQKFEADCAASGGSGRSDSKNVVVRHDVRCPEGGRGLFATRDFASRVVILTIPIPEGKLRDTPNMHSIQMGDTTHWDTTGEDVQYTQHAMDPNCKFVVVNKTGQTDPADGTAGLNVLQGTRILEAGDERAMLLISRRAIEKGALLTANYNSFEFGPLADPFKCVDSGREVNGFQFADTDEREFLKKENLVFDWLLKMWEREQSRK